MNTHAADENVKEEAMLAPIEVDWDGPDDPKNPLNWSSTLRYGHVATVSALTLLTSLAASIFAPAVPQVMEEFEKTSTTLGTLVVSIYVLGLAISPLIISPLSEQFGRLWIYHACNLLFCVFNVACALSQSLPQLIVFRLFTGCFGAAPVSMGGGTMADIFPPEKRGAVMSLWAIGPLFGPVIGPIAGGFLAESEGWRWVFWVVVIATGAFSAVGVLVLRETYAVVLLERKAQKLRRQHNNPSIRSKLASDQTRAETWKFAIVRPLKLLFFDPIVLFLSLYTALCYGFLFLFFTTFTHVFMNNYGFSPGISGLSYLGLGVGMLSGLVVTHMLMDRISKKLAKDGPIKPEYRLPLMIGGAPLLPVGLFWYGWSAHAHAHWIVPIIGTGVVGLSLITVFLPSQTYLVDAYKRYAASAIAANILFRSLLGCAIPLFGAEMYDVLGLGWGNSLLGFLAVASIPMPFIFFKYGERLRERSKVKL